MTRTSLVASTAVFASLFATSASARAGDDPWADMTTDASTDDTSSAPPPPPAAPVDTSTRPVPQHKGTGMIAGAAVAGGIGLALNAGRIGWHMRTCRAVDRDELRSSCFASIWGDVFLAVPAWFANMGSIGLAAGGGVMRGRWEAATGRKRDARKAIIAGATLVGVGGALYITSALARFATVGCYGSSLACYRGMYIGTTVGVQVGLSTAAVGAGLVAFGDQYRRRARRYSVAVAPQLSREYAGLSIAGRF